MSHQYQLTWSEMCARVREHPGIYLYGNLHEPSPANFFETALHGLLDIDSEIQLSQITFLSSVTHNSIEVSGIGECIWTHTAPLTVADFTEYKYGDSNIGCLWWAKVLIWLSEYAILDLHQNTVNHRFVFSEACLLSEQHTQIADPQHQQDRIGLTFQPLLAHRRYAATRKQLSAVVSGFRRRFAHPLPEKLSSRWYVPKAAGMHFISWGNGESLVITIRW